MFSGMKVGVTDEMTTGVEVWVGTNGVWVGVGLPHAERIHTPINITTRTGVITGSYGCHPDFIVVNYSFILPPTFSFMIVYT